jgi:hypothetical protein
VAWLAAGADRTQCFPWVIAEQAHKETPGLCGASFKEFTPPSGAELMHTDGVQSPHTTARPSIHRCHASGLKDTLGRVYQVVQPKGSDIAEVSLARSHPLFITSNHKPQEQRHHECPGPVRMWLLGLEPVSPKAMAVRVWVPVQSHGSV